MTPSPTATDRPEPEIIYEIPTPVFNKYRRAMKAGYLAFSEARRMRLAIAAHKANEFAKMDRFFRNCAMNDRIDMRGW